MPAAVAVLIAFPMPGIQPTKNCETVLPAIDAPADAIILLAPDSVIFKSNTAPNPTIIPI